MCRLVIYKGTEPVLLSHLLTRPAHSIINQSFDSRLRVDRRRPINGDGFGVGEYDSVYDPELGKQPCIFTSVTPAWNNINLTRIAEKIKSPLVFGHVRATTAGSLSLDNCHPFGYKNYMFMHNGQISEFPRIKRKLQERISDEIFDIVQGNTDSEWVFALYLSFLPNLTTEHFPHKVLHETMLKTIAFLNQLADHYEITEPRYRNLHLSLANVELTRFSLMNFCITDGVSVVATRYVSSKTDAAASLWFSSGTSFSELGCGQYRMSKCDKRENIIMIASEPLTFEKADWMEVRTNTVIVITPKMNVLQIPIIDEFYVPPNVSDHHERSLEFAANKGYFSSMSRPAGIVSPPPPPSASIEPILS